MKPLGSVKPLGALQRMEGVSRPGAKFQSSGLEPERTAAKTLEATLLLCDVEM